MTAVTDAPSGMRSRVASWVHLPGLDGVRAIAVLGVILFHADNTWLAGGFLGVDVFFVISGFLITGLLVRERERTGTVSLRAFYARRVRRLLPAATVVLYPFRVITAPALARSLGEWAGAMGPALLMLLLHVFWVLRSQAKNPIRSTPMTRCTSAMTSRAAARGSSSSPRGASTSCGRHTWRRTTSCSCARVPTWRSSTRSPTSW